MIPVIRRDGHVASKRTTADRYEDVLAGTKPAKGEKAAVTPYLEPEETPSLRQSAEKVGEVEGRTLLEGAIVVVVTDRKVVFARTSGGFRPQWEVFTLPFGHLEPGVVAGGPSGTDVLIPTSGRRSYRVQLADTDSAAALSASLGGALRAYRRDRMHLDE